MIIRTESGKINIALTKNSLNIQQNVSTLEKIYRGN